MAKFDSKIRFQNPNFRKQLQSARGYKRVAKKIREKDSDFFWNNWSLKGKLISIGCLLVAAGVVYLFFIPNFLFIKTIDIAGLSYQERDQTKQLITEYFKAHQFPPQQNALLLNKTKFAQYITEKNQEILSIKAIRTSLPHTIYIEVEKRGARYLTMLESGVFVVSNDGVIMEKIEATTTPVQYANLIKVAAGRSLDTETNSSILSVDNRAVMGELLRTVPEVSGVQVASFEFKDLNGPDITFVTQNGYKVLLQKNADFPKILGNLKQLLGKMSASDIQNLYYIDLRFEDRGYVCFNNTPCTKETEFGYTATTTLSSFVEYATSTASTTTKY